jgi:hypothetical protein
MTLMRYPAEEKLISSASAGARAGSARSGVGRPGAPSQVQAEEVGEALAGVQPQVQADAQLAGAVAGQVAGREERPGGSEVGADPGRGV